eukprot:2164737-Pleurochrysis_carterae.AAC.2
MSVGSQPRTRRTLTPLRLSMLPWGPTRTSASWRARGVSAFLCLDNCRAGTGTGGSGLLVSDAHCRRQWYCCPPGSERARARTPRVCASPPLRDVHRANSSSFPGDSGPRTLGMSTRGAAGRVVFYP